ncbi:MAG TPA: glycoside hydrolase family 3 C-terminal domain-containing protein, partial [Polyangiaceae bacterium]
MTTPRRRAELCVTLTSLFSIALGCSRLDPPTGTIPPLDWGALQAGNLGATCDRPELDARVESVLARMTLEQKVYEMHGRQLTSIDGLYYAGGNVELGIPPFKMVDGPRGVRSGKATAFPVAMARGATWDPELERRVGIAIARETLAKGGNVLLAPTVNVLRHPAWGRAQETYSEDPTHMGSMAVGFIGGAQNHVLSSVKHFAVNSIENSRFTVSADIDERTLREVYLPHFERAVKEAHVASVMSAYNRVNGVYAAENPHLLSDILKGEWGFPGFVESDWVLGTRSTVPSLFAGLDLEMPVAIYYGDALFAAAQNDARATARIDDAVRRILRQKYCFGLDSTPEPDVSVVESPAHVALAREVAEQAVVLLKNQSATLPLEARPGATIAIVGALADFANLGDRGSSSVTPSTAITPLQGMKDAAPGVDFVEILTDAPTEEELARIAAADVAVVVTGLTYRDESEFIPAPVDGLEGPGDRTLLELPSERQQLITRVAGRAKRTVVVLEGGSSIVVRSWVDSVHALLMAWYPGMQGGAAIANVLFGTVNPSGKLPITFARSAADFPPFDNVSSTVKYDYFHGYRLLHRNGRPPEFPFGFGLSYTTFGLARLSVDRTIASKGDVVTVRVDVGNTGSRAGAEVVQLYVSYRGSAVERPERELRAFRRVSLAPRNVKTVEFALDT